VAGMDRIEELDREMEARGPQVRRLPDLLAEHALSIADVIAELEAGTSSACWSLDESARRRAAAATRDWAREQLGDLDEQRQALTGSEWRAYRLPD
jgi:hypothetical protein